MSSGGGTDEGDLDLQAAEFVIGTLDLDERTAFHARLISDNAASRAVAAWEHRLAGLGGQIDPVLPPQYLWERIERALAGPSAKTHPFKVIDGGGRPSVADGMALRRSRNRWRMGALLSGAVAAALALFVAGKGLRPAGEVDATYVAAVNRGGDKPALIVRVDLKTGQVLVRPVAATAPAGRSLELWYIGTDKTPRSMGLVPADAAHLNLPAGTASDAATFAVSVEPPGGSKTGGPTGPVVYMGQLVKE